jgi:hypothetical protein
MASIRKLLWVWIPASALMLACALLWQVAFTAPSFDPQPLPPDLIALSTTEGRVLAQNASGADLKPLADAFEAQQRPAYCGVASAVIVLNALRRTRLAQSDVLDGWLTTARVTLGGMTLDELGRLLAQHGADVDVVHTELQTLDGFRDRLRENLGRAGDYVLVNYQRSALGQRPGGHISPVAAYSEASDRFLVLDVASHRYPAVWVRSADLWAAVHTIDPASGRTRGFVVVGERPSVPASSR